MEGGLEKGRSAVLSATEAIGLAQLLARVPALWNPVDDAVIPSVSISDPGTRARVGLDASPLTRASARHLIEQIRPVLIGILIHQPSSVDTQLLTGLPERLLRLLFDAWIAHPRPTCQITNAYEALVLLLKPKFTYEHVEGWLDSVALLNWVCQEYNLPSSVELLRVLAARKESRPTSLVDFTPETLPRGLVYHAQQAIRDPRLDSKALFSEAARNGATALCETLFALCASPAESEALAEHLYWLSVSAHPSFIRRRMEDATCAHRTLMYCLLKCSGELANEIAHEYTLHPARLITPRNPEERHCRTAWSRHVSFLPLSTCKYMHEQFLQSLQKQKLHLQPHLGNDQYAENVLAPTKRPRVLEKHLPDNNVEEKKPVPLPAASSLPPNSYMDARLRVQASATAAINRVYKALEVAAQAHLSRNAEGGAASLPLPSPRGTERSHEARRGH